MKDQIETLTRRGATAVYAGDANRDAIVLDRIADPAKNSYVVIVVTINGYRYISKILFPAIFFDPFTSYCRDVFKDISELIVLDLAHFFFFTNSLSDYV